MPAVNFVYVMADNVVNIKVCSPLKLHSGLTSNKPAIGYAISSLPLLVQKKYFTR